MDIISTIQVALYDFIFARKNIPFPLVITYYTPVQYHFWPILRVSTQAAWLICIDEVQASQFYPDDSIGCTNTKTF